MCHVYGYTPRQVLDLPRSHFYMLCRNIGHVERESAKFVALAFNDPQQLWNVGEEKNQIKQIDLNNDADVVEMLTAMNG